MRKITWILLVSLVMLVAIPFQSATGGNGPASACPEGGCRIYLPIARTAGEAMKVGLVTDPNGIDDKSLNEMAWEGVMEAEAKLGISGAYLESEDESDFAPHINQFISEEYDLIVTVGWQLGDATKEAAEANPDQMFSIVDHAYDPVLPNLLSQVFLSEEAAFLAGYLAAGMTQTGKVATYGGMQIPPVTAFMNGYFQGVSYYNQENSASVEVLGWDMDTQTGEFTGTFADQAAGYTMGQKLLGLGADIIFPVAGPTGLGTAQRVQEQGEAWVIGVDNDWMEAYAQYADVVLTSAMKYFDATTYAVIELAYLDNFSGGIYIGSLANGGVGLGTVAASVPAELLTKIEQIKADIIAGTIVVTP